MIERQEDVFDAELAETFSLICFDECCGCPSDIGIVLAVAAYKHGEKIKEEEANELANRI